jgi:hypothetical protein
VNNDDGGQLDVAAVAASGRRASNGNQLSFLALLSGKRRVGEASSSKEMRDGGQKESLAFSMPFKTARENSSRHMDDSNEDGFLLGSMLCMMMPQSQIELE